MNEFFASLISGVVSLFMQNKMNERQHVQNISDWQMQNEYNERMYNNYNSPAARAEQLKNAGLSDAAIGQALSGFNGSGTSIQSSPLQPTNMAEMFSSIFGNVNDTMRLGNETALNKSEIRLKGAEIGLKGKELQLFEATFENLVNKSALDVQMTEKQITAQNLDNYIKENTKQDQIDAIKKAVDKLQSEIDLNDAQKDNLLKNVEYVQARINEINDLKDVRQWQAEKARFEHDFYIKWGIPIDVAVDAGKVGAEVLKGIFNMFGLRWFNITKN